MRFDMYAFADYSGSQSAAEQRKRIVLAQFEHRTGEFIVTKGLSRLELWVKIVDMLHNATARGQRMLFGFDHSYSFPLGFYKAMSGQEWASWPHLLNLLAEPQGVLPALGEDWSKRQLQQARARFAQHTYARDALDWMIPRFEGSLPAREWAKRVNERFGNGGPFWGANWPVQMNKPKHMYGPRLPELRLVEQACQTWQHKNMKSIYQLGGVGSVGLQSLYGMRYLRELIVYCQSHAIPLTAWPFDGFSAKEQGHVLTEVYPTLYNNGVRSDEEDAKSCVSWFLEQDQRGGLVWEPPQFLSKKETQRATLEGWVHGIAPHADSNQIKNLN